MLGSGAGFRYRIWRAQTGGRLTFQGDLAGYTGYEFLNDSGRTDLIIIDSGNVGVGTITPTGQLQVHNDGSGIKVLNADSDPNVFEVYGDNGTIFTVADDLSDSLMSVNNAAGLPVFEVFADNTVVALSLIHISEPTRPY